jgi:hypothetical protein
LSSFQTRKNSLEVSELTKRIDVSAMQENDSRAIALIMVSDVDSIKGYERIQPAPPSTVCFDPGACAPGFMLPPASQANTALKVVLTSISEFSTPEEYDVYSLAF